MKKPPATVRIEPASAGGPAGLRELREYRELLCFLVWKSVRVRYKQTALGAAWAVIQPLMTMVVFSVFFGRLARVPSDGIPYPIFAYTALVPWQYFSAALTRSAGAVVEHQTVITKIYFPRLLLPVAAVAENLLDFAVAFAILIAMMAAYRVHPTPAVAAVPLLLALAVGAALGAGLWLSALNVLYRDVRYTVAFLVQTWLFATPVAYPSSLVPERWRAIYGLNPMVGVIEGFRWALLGRTAPDPAMMLSSVASTVLLLAGGLYFFGRVEHVFADVV